MMIYTEDEQRSSFAKASPMLQVVCSIVEFEAAKYSAQVELYDFGSGWALVTIPELHMNLISDVCNRVNSVFPRKDMQSTAALVDVKLCAVKVIANHPSDLAHLL